jgi:uncharacterized protein YndB with AHSA1/START domain
VTSSMPFTPDPKLDLFFDRLVDVSPELVWTCWTTPEHLVKWFSPAPWVTTECTIDLRPGGLFHTVMRGPEGQSFPVDGCYLEVVPNRRLVWTDALAPGFRPKDGGFFTGVIALEPEGSGTRYRAMAIHKTEGDRAKHAAMGFEQGWGTALEQLVAHAKTL